MKLIKTLITEIIGQWSRMTLDHDQLLTLTNQF